MNKVGDIVEFKGKGSVHGILSRLIWLFERWWDRWGWHVAFICGYDNDRGPLICESVAGGVRVIPLREVAGGYGEYRIHSWFEESPEQSKVDAYVESVLGAKYDVTIYLWTALQYLVRHLINRRIPRLLDNRYTCWENVFFFCREMGKPIQAIYDCPMITDLLKGLGAYQKS